MRYIKVPADVLVRPPASSPGEKPELTSFARFASLAWLDDQRAVPTFQRQVRWAKVCDILLSTKPGAVVSLEDEDYATLRAIVEEPQVRAPATVLVQLIPFTQAVLDALPEKPVDTVAREQAQA